MKVSSITPNITNFAHKENKGINIVSWSGYGAVATGIASGIAGHKKKIKLHKNLAYITAALSAIHIGVVEYKKHTYKKQNQ